MPAIYKRIHMPKPLYDEIEAYVAKLSSPHKTVADFCREAGHQLIEHYQLREKHA